MFSRLSILVCIVAALGLSACGRRGPLELPPGSPPEQKATPKEPSKSPPPGAPGGLFRNTSSKTDEPGPQTEPAKPRPSPFVLDPLL